MPEPALSITAVGIDVGGERKGFHAVAIKDGQYADRYTSASVPELVRWCTDTVQAQIIAVDAPCGWSADGRCRPAERALMQKGIWCFSTPMRATALERRRQHGLGRATDHYGWMLGGERIFTTLKDHYPLCRSLPAIGQRLCFETYPHAITWHLRGGNADARKKHRQRRQLLAAAGLDCSRLTNIDLVDAALCALTAYHAATGRGCISYGEQNSGLIIVPALSTS